MGDAAQAQAVLPRFERGLGRRFHPDVIVEAYALLAAQPVGELEADARAGALRVDRDAGHRQPGLAAQGDDALLQLRRLGVERRRLHLRRQFLYGSQRLDRLVRLAEGLVHQRGDAPQDGDAFLVLRVELAGHHGAVQRTILVGRRCCHPGRTQLQPDRRRTAALGDRLLIGLDGTGHVLAVAGGARLLQQVGDHLRLRLRRRFQQQSIGIGTGVGQRPRRRVVGADRSA